MEGALLRLDDKAWAEYERQLGIAADPDVEWEEDEKRRIREQFT